MNCVICQWRADLMCRSRRLRQIIDLRDTEKLRYFATTEFNNCFIFRSPSLFFNEFLWEAKRSAIFTQERSQEGESLVSFTHEQNIIFRQTKLNDIAHEKTIICACTPLTKSEEKEILFSVWQVNAPLGTSRYLSPRRWRILRGDHLIFGRTKGGISRN